MGGCPSCPEAFDPGVGNAASTPLDSSDFDG
jgi:hypothetical protein